MNSRQSQHPCLLQDKLHLVMVAIYVVQAFQMGVATISNNPSGAKKLWLLKRQVPTADPDRARFADLLHAHGLTVSTYAAPVYESADTQRPPHASRVVFDAFDVNSVDQILQTWASGEAGQAFLGLYLCYP